MLETLSKKKFLGNFKDAKFKIPKQFSKIPYSPLTTTPLKKLCRFITVKEVMVGHAHKRNKWNYLSNLPASSSAIIEKLHVFIKHKNSVLTLFSSSNASFVTIYPFSSHYHYFYTVIDRKTKKQRVEMQFNSK